MLADEEDEWYYSRPEFKEQLERYEQAVRQGASIYMDADELADIAEYYMMQHREQEADQVISLSLALHPNSVDSQVFLARKQLFDGNIDEAKRICQGIVDQEDREVKFLYAEILIKEDRGRDAVAYMLQVYRTLDEARDHFLYDTSNLFADYCLWEYALMWTNRLIRLNPAYPKVYQQKAELLVCLGRYAESIPVLNKILDADPYHKDMWNLLAEAQGATGHYAEALDAVEYVLAIDKDDVLALATKAGCMYHMQKPAEAHQLYSRYLKETPDDGHVMFLDAVCLSTLERYEEAAQQLERALALCTPDSDDYAHMLVEKAYVESKLHHADKAMEAIAFVENIRGGNDDCEYNLIKGQVQLASGLIEEAAASFGTALRVSDDKCHTLLAIALAFGDAGIYDNAIQVLLAMQRGGVVDECDFSPIPYLAFYYYQMGDKVTSLAYLRDAARADRLHTEQLFASIYPGVTPDEYYLYAYRDVHGHFPDEKE